MRTYLEGESRLGRVERSGWRDEISDIVEASIDVAYHLHEPR